MYKAYVYCRVKNYGDSSPPLEIMINNDEELIENEEKLTESELVYMYEIFLCQ